MYDKSAGYYPRPELNWFPEYPSKPDSNWVLCYRMKGYSAEPLFHDQVYIRADNGIVLFRENLLHDINTYGTAVTKYSGTQSIRVDSMSTDDHNGRYEPVFLNLASGEYQIYDRWGAMIYHCQDIYQCQWSGPYRPENRSPGRSLYDYFQRHEQTGGTYSTKQYPPDHSLII